MKLSAAFWLTYVARSRRWWRSSAAAAAPMSCPPTSRSPVVGRSRPASARRSVDLPLPEEPTTAVISPSENDASTECNASIPPLGVTYVFESARQVTSGSGNAQRLAHVGSPCKPARERPDHNREQ